MFKIKETFILICLFFFAVLDSKKVRVDDSVALNRSLSKDSEKKDQIKFAVFDVNGCFWKPQTSDIFNKFLETSKLKLSLWDKVKMGGYFVAHKLGTINVKNAYEGFLTKCKGLSQDDIDKSTKIIWDDCCKDFIYKKSVSIFNEHKKKGNITIIASASPHEIYRDLLKHYKFDYVCATVMEKRDGALTGKLVGPPCSGKDKKMMIKRLVEDKLKGSMKQTVFYGRSQLDIPVMLAVGKPVAFNPDPKLRAYAKARGWEIIDDKDFLAIGKKF